MGRPDIALLVAGALGVAWMMRPSPTPPIVPLTWPPAASVVGELAPMRGPYPSLQDACPTCELDVKTVAGDGPIDEMTVLHIDQPSGLVQGQLELALRIGNGWWFHEIGWTGAICTAGASGPGWVETTADAPRIDGRRVVVHTHETSETHASWTVDHTCEVPLRGAPFCRDDL